MHAKGQAFIRIYAMVVRLGRHPEDGSDDQGPATTTVLPLCSTDGLDISSGAPYLPLGTKSGLVFAPVDQPA